MATIDLTLDSFKVPAIESYTPPFGTKIVKTDTNKGGLSTVEVNSNIMMPFANMRPKVITENSSTTEIEYDAKLCFSASLLAGATLELDDGAYEGCRVQITNLSSYTCIVEYDNATLVSVPIGANVEVLWTGSAWMLSTTGTVATGNVMPPTSSAVHAAIAAKMPDYSTTEQPTGRKWIDGKPIYSQTFDYSSTSLPNGTVLITGVSCLINEYGYVLIEGKKYPYPQQMPSNSGGTRRAYINSSNNLVSESSSSIKCIFTVEYTKTTDPTP